MIERTRALGEPDDPAHRQVNLEGIVGVPSHQGQISNQPGSSRHCTPKQLQLQAEPRQWGLTLNFLYST